MHPLTVACVSWISFVATKYQSQHRPSSGHNYPTDNNGPRTTTQRLTRVDLKWWSQVNTCRLLQSSSRESHSEIVWGFHSGLYRSPLWADPSLRSQCALSCFWKYKYQSIWLTQSSLINRPRAVTLNLCLVVWCLRTWISNRCDDPCR